MATRQRQWTSLGLGALASAAVLGACGAPDSEAEDTSAVEEAPVVTDSATVEPSLPAIGGEGESGGEGEGEGGEGEGGVSISAATTDPIVYNAALAITEAHILAARDAYALGETDAAGEMFAHPVSEVLFDMQPVFEARGVEDFSDLLTDASAAVFAGATQDDINARADEIVAVLRDAATKAPDDGSPPAEIAVGVLADQIERAADMYRVAAGSDAYEPYLDGYGFYKAAAAAFEGSASAIEANDASVATAIQAALVELDAAYPTATRPDTLDADQSALTVAASEVVLAINN